MLLGSLAAVVFHIAGAHSMLSMNAMDYIVFDVMIDQVIPDIDL